MISYGLLYAIQSRVSQALTRWPDHPVAPGMFNQIFCKVNATYVASTTDVTVLSWGLFQIKTDP